MKSRPLRLRDIRVGGLYWHPLYTECYQITEMKLHSKFDRTHCTVLMQSESGRKIRRRCSSPTEGSVPGWRLASEPVIQDGVWAYLHGWVHACRRIPITKAPLTLDPHGNSYRMWVSKAWAEASVAAWCAGDPLGAALYAQYARFNTEFDIPTHGHFSRFAKVARSR